MANKFLISLLLFISFSKGYSQSTKKVIYVYDTVTVYDTIYVYDTIKEGLLSDKITSVEKALLEIDTASLKSQLTLFNKADTATIFIDSILLSNNLNKKDTMKKNILIALAAGLISYTADAQDSLVAISKTDSLKKNETDFVFQSSKEKIIFQKIEKPERTYEVLLPIKLNPNQNVFYNTTGIALNKKIKLPKGWHSGTISKIDSSKITIRYFKKVSIFEQTRIDNKATIGMTKQQRKEYFKNKGKEYQEEQKRLKVETDKIKNDTSITKDEKTRRVLELKFRKADSISISMADVKTFRFSKINSKNKIGYEIWSRTNGVILYGGYGGPIYYSLVTGAATVSLPAVIVIYSVGFVSSITYDLCSKKTIKMKKWKLLTEKEITDLNLNASN